MPRGSSSHESSPSLLTSKASKNVQPLGRQEAQVQQPLGHGLGAEYLLNLLAGERSAPVLVRGLEGLAQEVQAARGGAALPAQREEPRDHLLGGNARNAVGVQRLRVHRRRPQVVKVLGGDTDGLQLRLHRGAPEGPQELLLREAPGAVAVRLVEDLAHVDDGPPQADHGALHLHEALAELVQGHRAGPVRVHLVEEHLEVLCYEAQLPETPRHVLASEDDVKLLVGQETVAVLIRLRKDLAHEGHDAAERGVQ
eukprot:6833527-Lingulodinium_polyedra.AAC.1